MVRKGLAGPWCHHEHAYVHAQGDFWSNVKDRKLNINMSLKYLADVAFLVRSVLQTEKKTEGRPSERNLPLKIIL